MKSDHRRRQTAFTWISLQPAIEFTERNDKLCSIIHQRFAVNKLILGAKMFAVAVVRHLFNERWHEKCFEKILIETNVTAICRFSKWFMTFLIFVVWRHQAVASFWISSLKLWTLNSVWTQQKFAKLSLE